MNKKLIEQIKNLPGVKEVHKCDAVTDRVVVVFEPKRYLFTTEDGVKIHEGDYSTVVRKDTMKVSSTSSFEGDDPESFFYFSTREAAEEYIKQHKPILTTDDGVEILTNDDYWYTPKVNNKYLFGGPEYPQERNGEFLNDRKYWCVFSTREAAEKYIKDNSPKPVYIDHNTGVEFYEGDEYFNYNTATYEIKKCHVGLGVVINGEGVFTNEVSKPFKTRKECEIDIAETIKNKYNEKKPKNAIL